jgi:crotonobetainyl-CoA:carnitine CoA-transferase CaiB-like acyl-CoA transferase
VGAVVAAATKHNLDRAPAGVLTGNDSDEGVIGTNKPALLKDDPRFATRDARVPNYIVLERVLAEAISRKDRSHWVAARDPADVPFATVQTVAEVLEDPQIKHHSQSGPSDRGGFEAMRRLILIDGNRDVRSRRPPMLGEHTAEALAESASSNPNRLDRARA